MKILLYTIAVTIFPLTAIPCESDKVHEKYTAKDCSLAISNLSALINDKNYYVNYTKNHKDFDAIYSKHKELISSNHEAIEICLVYYEPKKLFDIYTYVALLTMNYKNMYSADSLQKHHKYIDKTYTKEHLELIEALEAYTRPSTNAR
ncbi:hypothetical protein NO559_08475 [Dasania sp. GY-MA-18]|uniref:Uncharacterized protein n=1 Tax=Dasania phycosphaerae TaxID=2950436 RepID=A0A9J6RLN4_9GAMM|nr:MULTISPECIES: hypothetical protein [Dasania]MCR8922803.1 hypothetical protein [Dasania sp. GY-MA-18]MCZ0865233.1 hypothetical protein [Dasania phycosphaerae]MCZ0868959.1 hypothetical protein [Dasania phycosphaerae]